MSISTTLTGAGYETKMTGGNNAALKRAVSAMYLGDSITAAGGHFPNTPSNRSTQPLFPALTNINAAGLFVVGIEVGPLTPNGAGTLRYYAGNMSMTWQAFGDTEGVQIRIPTSGFYALPSGAGGESTAIFISIVARLRPDVDKSDTVTATGVNRWLKNNVSSFGFMGWTQALLGPVINNSYCYAIPTIRASDWLAAKDQWRFKYTDLSVICLGTNDIDSQAAAVKALADLRDIAKLRMAIGSTVILGCLFPYNSRTATQTAAIMWFNRGLRSLGEELNVDVFDAWNYLADPVGTGGYASGMSLDGLHPSSLGGYIIAKRCLVPIIRKFITPQDVRQFANSLYSATALSGNLLTNGVLSGITGTNGTGSLGEVPANWTSARNSGSVIAATVKSPDSAQATPRTDGQLGKYASFAISNALGVDRESMMFRTSAFNNIGWAPGDYLVFEGDMRISGTGMAYISAAGVVGGRSFYGLSPQTDSVMGSLDGDVVTIQFRTQPMLVETGDTNLTVNIITSLMAAGACVLDIGQTITIYKVSAPTA